MSKRIQVKQEEDDSKDQTRKIPRTSTVSTERVNLDDSALTPESASSPIPSALSNWTTFYPSSQWRIVSRPASENKNCIVMERNISTSFLRSTENWTSQIRDASTSLSDLGTTIEIYMEDFELHTIPTSSELQALTILCDVMNISARMERLLLSYAATRDSCTPSLRTLLENLETALTGLNTSAQLLNQDLNGRFSAPAAEMPMETNFHDSSFKTPERQERKDMLGSTVPRMRARPSGLRRTSIAGGTTRLQTTSTPLTNTSATLRSSSTMTRPLLQPISSALPTRRNIQDQFPERPGTSDTPFQPDLPPGSSFAPTSQSNQPSATRSQRP